jgi:AcrR family transcriptional regulator
MTPAPVRRERLSPRFLSTADERREEVLRAAMKVMGTRGLYGTPTMDIARAAGISQAYLFRLFPTKLGLFLAVVERSFQQIRDDLERAGRAAPACWTWWSGCRGLPRRESSSSSPAGCCAT